MLSVVRCDRAQVTYLGGITFLLKDRCPTGASSAARAQYETCAATQKLHVSCWSPLLASQYNRAPLCRRSA